MPLSPAFPDVPETPSGATPDRHDPEFRLLQVFFWPFYGAALMLPWIGTYTIASMLPNKFVIAVTGAIAAAGLRFVYQLASRQRLSSAALLGIAMIASIVVGFAWDGVLYAILGRWAHFDVARFGTLGAGVPQFAGGLYHALVLATWSMAYLLLKGGRTGMNNAPAPTPTPALPPLLAPDRIEHPAPRASTRVVLQDGKRSMVFEAGEIDWVESDGDYLHVHAGERRLYLRATISGTERVLPVNDYVRIHRSTIVRISQVRELVSRPNHEFEVILRNGTRLRASRSYAQRLRNALDISGDGTVNPMQMTRK